MSRTKKSTGRQSVGIEEYVERPNSFAANSAHAEGGGRDREFDRGAEIAADSSPTTHGALSTESPRSQLTK